MDPALTVTIITKLAPSLYEQAMKAFHGKTMKPKKTDAALLKRYLAEFNRRRVFDARVRDGEMKPVIKSIDEVRAISHGYVARLHDYPRGQVMAEAIVDSCQRFLDKWAMYKGTKYNVTYDGEPSGPKTKIPAGPRRANALFEAFTQDLQELRHSVNILREGIGDIIKEGAPAWGGWVLNDVAPVLAVQAVKSLSV